MQNQLRGDYNNFTHSLGLYWVHKIYSLYSLMNKQKRLQEVATNSLSHSQ